MVLSFSDSPQKLHFSIIYKVFEMKTKCLSQLNFYFRLLCPTKINKVLWANSAIFIYFYTDTFLILYTKYIKLITLHVENKDSLF